MCGRACQRPDRRTRTLQFVREVGHQRAFGPRVVHRRNTAAARPPSRGEQFEGVGELRQIAHMHRAGGGAEGLPRRMFACQRPRVRGDHRASARRPADGEHDHRHVLLGGAQQRPAQPRDRARRLQQQRDDPRFGIVQRIVDIVGGVRHELLSGGHREPESEATARPQQRRERRAGMGDERSPALRQRIWFEIAEGPHTERVVDESHAARPAHRHAGVGRGRRDLLAQAMRGPEQHRRPRTASQPRVPTAPTPRRRAPRAAPRRQAGRDRRATARRVTRRRGRSAD